MSNTIENLRPVCSRLLLQSKQWLFVCLVVLACMVAVAHTFPSNKDDESNFFKPQIQPTYTPPIDHSKESGESSEKNGATTVTTKTFHKRSAEEAQGQPRQPLNNGEQSKPESEPQADQPRAPEKRNRRGADDLKTTSNPSASSTPNRDTLTKPAPKPEVPATPYSNKKEKRSTEEVKTTSNPSASTIPSRGSLTKPAPKPEVTATSTSDKKDKRETETTKETPKEVAVPATVAIPTTSNPNNLNTPSHIQPAIQPIGKPIEPLPVGLKRDRRGVDHKDTSRKPAPATQPANKPVAKPVAKPALNTPPKHKREAEEHPLTKPAGEITPTEVKPTIRPLPTPAKHD